MKLSIIICTYNSGGRLERTLDSILSQDEDDFEVIIVDGASNDGTVEIIKDYEAKFDRRLRWISEKDNGIYEAMNKGIGIAKGEYLNVVGAGDWLEKNALVSVFECIKKNPDADAVYGILKMWNRDLKENYLLQTGPENLLTQPMQHPALFYKKKLHDKFGLYDESYRVVSDYLFCMKVFLLGKAKAVSFDSVVDNYVLDGISTDVKTCKKEGVRAQRELKLIPNRFMRFIYKRLNTKY